LYKVLLELKGKKKYSEDKMFHCIQGCADRLNIMFKDLSALLLSLKDLRIH